MPHTLLFPAVLLVCACLCTATEGSSSSGAGKFLVLQEGSRVGSHYVEELLEKCPEIWMPVAGRDWMVDQTTEIVTHSLPEYKSHPSVLLSKVHTYWESLSGTGKGEPQFRIFGFRTSTPERYATSLYHFMKRSLSSRRASSKSTYSPRVLVLRRRDRLHKIISSCVAIEHAKVCQGASEWAIRKSDDCLELLYSTPVNVTNACLASQAQQEEALYNNCERFLRQCREDSSFLFKTVYYEDLTAGSKEDQAAVVRDMFKFLGVDSSRCPFTPDMLKTSVQKQIADYSKQVRDYDRVLAEAKKLFQTHN